MSTKNKFHRGRHLSALGVLVIIDLHQRLRSWVSREFLRVTVVILSAILIAIIFSSVVALIRITRSVQSLVGDSLVGLETSVDMRATVRESQLDLLRLRLNPDRELTSLEIESFHSKMTVLIGTYRRGVFEEADGSNARAIENGCGLYLAALAPLRDKPQPQLEAILTADIKAKELVDVVERAYQFNRERIHSSANEAGGAAKQALHSANLLGWSFGLFIVCLALVYFAYRWLALPEENDV